jgi:hypothetical protein
MLGIILRVIACLLFLLAAVNQTIFSQPPADLVAFGLLAWCLATLIGGYGPQWNRAA